MKLIIEIIFRISLGIPITLLGFYLIDYMIQNPTIFNIITISLIAIQFIWNGIGLIFTNFRLIK